MTRNLFRKSFDQTNSFINPSVQIKETSEWSKKSAAWANTVAMAVNESRSSSVATRLPLLLLGRRRGNAAAREEGRPRLSDSLLALGECNNEKILTIDLSHSFHLPLPCRTGHLWNQRPPSELNGLYGLRTSTRHLEIGVRRQRRTIERAEVSKRKYLTDLCFVNLCFTLFINSVGVPANLLEAGTVNVLQPDGRRSTSSTSLFDSRNL